MSHFAVFYPRGGGRYLIEIIYSIPLISRFQLGKKIPIIYKKLEAGSWKLASLRSWGFSRKFTVNSLWLLETASLRHGIQAPLRGVQVSHFVRSSIPAMRISMDDLIFEHFEAVLEC
jgi:hypothetical protein